MSPHKYASRPIVNENGGVSTTVVGIKVGDDPAQMNRMTALGLIDAEVVRFPRRGENASPHPRALCGFGIDRHSQICREKNREKQGRGNRQRTAASRQPACLSRLSLANPSHVLPQSLRALLLPVGAKISDFKRLTLFAHAVPMTDFHRILIGFWPSQL